MSCKLEKTLKPFFLGREISLQTIQQTVQKKQVVKVIFIIIVLTGFINIIKASKQSVKRHSLQRNCRFFHDSALETEFREALYELPHLMEVSILPHLFIFLKTYKLCKLSRRRNVSYKINSFDEGLKSMVKVKVVMQQPRKFLPL